MVCVNARGDLLNIVVEKRVFNYQVENYSLSTPSNGAFLDYYFEISGLPALQGASFAVNLVDLPIQFQDDLQWRGFVAFATQAELSSSYNDAYNYAFTTQLEGEFAKTAQTNFISSASFPFAQPLVTNYFNTSAVNPSSSFNVQLEQSAFGSAGIGYVNYIQMTLIDPVTITTSFNEVYSNTSIALSIPANTLNSNRDYLARIQFISPSTLTTVSAVNPYAVLTQYTNETWFRLSTTGVRQSLSPSLTRYAHWMQTDATTITADTDKDYLFGYVDQPTAANLSALTLAQLDVRKSYEFDTPTDEGTHDFELKLTGDDFDHFINGVISLGWRYTSGNTQLEIDNWDCAISTTAPLIANWDACQALPVGLDFSILIQQPDDLPNSATGTLVITDSEDEVVATIESDLTASNSQYAFVIPANTLTDTTTYQATLTIAGDGTTHANIDAQNAHTIEFDIMTSDSLWPGVATAGIYRGTYFDNGTGVTPSNDASMRFIIHQINGDGLEDAKVNRPITTRLFVLEQTSLDADVWQQVLLDDATAMANAYPDATYWFQTWKESILYTRQAPFTTPAVSAPSISVDTSALDASPDPSLPIPISWTGFDASADDMRVEAYITGAPAQSIPLQNIAADGLSGEIPGGVLDPETAYSVHLFFQRDVVVETDSYEDVEFINGDEFFTTLEFTTGPSAYTDWLAGYLSPEQLSDLSFTAANANPDGDALTNLQEFALNGNPLTPTTPPVLQNGSANYLLSFQFRSDSPLLSFAAETSTTLEPPFTAYAGSPLVTSGDPYDSVIYTFTKVNPFFARLIIRYGQVSE